MSRRNGSRIYWRHQGAHRRAYGDFRDFADVGGKREALIANGTRTATTDLVIAEQLAAARVKELQAKRLNRAVLGVEGEAYLGPFSEHHLKQKARSGRVVKRHLEQLETHLERACAFFGTRRELNTIGVKDVERWLHHLGERDNGRGGKLSPRTVRAHLNALSNLYRRAQGEARVPPGFNPASAVMDKPSARPAREAKWLEVHEAALFLESARTWKPDCDAHACPFMYPLVATFLLTGGRKSEVLGLEVDDVSFDRKTVTFRPNGYRRLKTSTSHRSVPLWPQLEETIRSYVFGGPGPRDGLLFPSARTGGRIHDVRKALDEVGKRVEIPAGEIRTKVFRHTFCAAALQLTEGGAAISPYTVAKWMGHGGRSLVDRVYGHLGEVRHRTEAVEYRVDTHRRQLGDRLTTLRASSASSAATK